jgi:hypothetical protein
MRHLTIIGLIGCANCFIHGTPEPRKKLSLRVDALRLKAASIAVPERSAAAPVFGAPIRLCEDVDKPLIDTKSYRVIELSNGLRCCLISDPKAEVGVLT